MLCSIPTGKSGSTWLDRLRSNKGFPTADNNLDLDHFISNTNNNDDEDDDDNNNNNSGSPSITNTASNSLVKRHHQEQPTTEISRDDHHKEWLTVSNALSDLFNMGQSKTESSSSSSKHLVKRSARKQNNPKFFCVMVSNSTQESVRRDGNDASLSSDNHYSNNNNNNKDYGKDDDGDDGDDVEVEEEEEKGSGNKELKGYSKSEVTVIDTSCEVWKFDKLVFRKKSVWKVRDKKGKSWTAGPKKRKRNDDLDLGNGNAVVNKKKAKVSNTEFGLSKDSSGGDHCVLPSIDGQKLQHEKRAEVCKETPDDISQVPKKRFCFSRSPRKSKKSGSSVILIKAIPPNKKSGSNLPKNRHKDTQKQHKA